MGFWEKVNTELKKTVGEGWTAVRDNARIGKLRYHKHSLNKKAEKHFAEIGGIVYDMAKPPWENPLSRPAVLKLIEEIKKVETEIAELEEEIEKTRHGEREEEEGPGVGPEASSETPAGEEKEKEGAEKG